MTEMLRNQNPGLARRFPREYAFIFDDYTPQELLKIFNLKCRDLEVTPNQETAKKALKVLKKQKKLANFGNAGAVEMLLRAADAKAALRGKGGGRISIEAADIGEEEEVEGGGGKDPVSALSKLRKMEGIRGKLEELKKTLEVREREGDKVSEVGNFVFRGSPGTGLFFWLFMCWFFFFCFFV